MKSLIISLLILFFLTHSLKADFQKRFYNNSFAQILLINDADTSQSSDIIVEDLLIMGYTVSDVTPDLVSQDLLNQYELVILSCGNNYNACRNSEMRLALQGYILGGGKTLIEGGDNGYIAAVSPFYLGFRNKVLRILSWVTHNGGDLILNNVHHESNLAISPNVLSNNLSINFSQNSDQDVCVKDEFSEVFYACSLYPNQVGILVYPRVTNPQLINFCFNYLALTDREEAVKLLQNTVFNLIGKPVGIANTSSVIPTEFKLYQNYPNPFNPKTVINYDLPKSEFVTIRLFNIIGNVVTVLKNEFQKAGSYSIAFDGKELSSGIYFYILNTDDFESVRRMVLIK